MFLLYTMRRRRRRRRGGGGGGGFTLAFRVFTTTLFFVKSLSLSFRAPLCNCSFVCCGESSRHKFQHEIFSRQILSSNRLLVFASSSKDDPTRDRRFLLRRTPPPPPRRIFLLLFLLLLSVPNCDRKWKFQQKAPPILSHGSPEKKRW